MDNVLIYISGPISAPTPEEWTANLEKGRQVAIELALEGIPFHSPHLNSWGFERETKLIHVKWQDYIDMDLEILSRCNGILMMEGWEDSKGADTERDFAIRNGIPVYYKIDQIKKFPPRKRYFDAN